MLLAIDVHSEAFRTGWLLAPFLLAAMVLIVLWSSTRGWRNPRPVRFPEDLARVTTLRRQRTRRVALWSVGIVAAAIALDLVVDLRTGGQYGSAASKGPTNLTVTAPESFGGFRLMTGAAADKVTAPTRARLPNRLVELYARTSQPDVPQITVFGDSATTDPRLAQELSSESADYAIVNFMAGAGITDASVLPPGPAGGEMQCGQRDDGLICTWADSGTEGALMARTATGITLQQLATLTRQFRVAAEH